MDDQHRSFLFLKYQADRVHELELDKVSSQYEIAFLQVAFLLNGGSATAFISVIGPKFAEMSEAGKSFFAFSVLSWMVGLLVALSAGVVAYSAQKGFAQAFRLRRNAISIGVFGNSDPIFLGTSPGDTAEKLANEANKKREWSSDLWDKVAWIGVFSIAFFVVGVFFAFQAAQSLPSIEH